MEIICLMGKALTCRQELEKQLQNLGYHKLIKYMISDETDLDSNEDYRKLTFQEYLTLKNQSAVLKWIQYDNVKYGIPRPFGYLKYVIVATPDIVEILKKEYKNQVYQVYIDNDKQSDSKQGDSKWGDSEWGDSEWDSIENSENKRISNSDTIQDKLRNLRQVQEFIQSPFQVKETDEDKARKQADIVVEQDENPKRLALKIVYLLDKLKKYNRNSQIDGN